MSTNHTLCLRYMIWPPSCSNILFLLTLWGRHDCVDSFSLRDGRLITFKLTKLSFSVYPEQNSSKTWRYLLQQQKQWIQHKERYWEFSKASLFNSNPREEANWNINFKISICQHSAQSLIPVVWTKEISSTLVQGPLSSNWILKELSAGMSK